jgi:hypothetical protein
VRAALRISFVWSLVAFDLLGGSFSQPAVITSQHQQRVSEAAFVLGCPFFKLDCTIEK